MARKGNHQKNGVEQRNAANHKKRGSNSGFAVPDTKGLGKVSDAKVLHGEELPNGNHPGSSFTQSVSKPHHVGDESKHKQSSGKSLRIEKQGMDTMQGLDHSVSSEINSSDCIENTCSIETSCVSEENGAIPGRYRGPKQTKSGSGNLLNGFHIKDLMENFDFSDNVTVRSLRASAVSIFKAMSDWLVTQKPLFVKLKTSIYKARDFARTKIEHAYPIVLKWLMHLGNIMLLLLMVWLDCTLRGIDSFLRMGTTSFFSVIWCSIFSVVAMTGMSKFLVVLVVAALTVVFFGFTLAMLVLAIFGTILLWVYGSFWTTVLVIFLGGLAFMLSHERLALLITTVYSMYCARVYVGWLGLLLALNFSFISSDALISYLKNNMNQQRRPNRSPEQTVGMEGQPGYFNGEPVHRSSSENGPGLWADRSPGVPSTSGTDSEITSEDEVARLLSCADHYSALGFSRYENVDVSILKREYRKKAMLVHPDKNMGNEKAAEAFKKLQNAYEVLLDSLKRKAYDDELRREELLNCFRRFQSSSQKNGGLGFFSSVFGRPEADGEDPFGDSRRIACKKCSNSHVWIFTKKSKSQARWCQECKDFHQAKDGDGWVEQSSQPFLFGLLQKVDAPLAFVCADSRIYDATEWYICQGMRCSANTHKPSFHVNTSLSSKHNTSKGSSAGQKGGHVPTTNLEDTMTEEEFFEWFQNAAQAGMFDNLSGSTPAGSPSTSAGSSTKGGASNGGIGNKRKKKGKRQW
ncbi:DnaJ domain-containing protein [Cephalotus follicularis]|uniref:DnaJ domain-containing protein n=1 Tax=Cephalotus follicularis TaxID=3775 RepID=A0A1Q3BUK5_CEPFO|nr:DnaJ domain-containing protein [Cephalotus follicularis]